MSASKPRWIRLDSCAFEHPKILRAIKLGGHESVTLWLRGITYSAQHLTDGWIAEELPRMWGYKSRHWTALMSAELWYEVPITDASGWLIHDYHEYQPTRVEWEKKSEARRVAANRRWENR